jgi:hypothetical protein
LKRLLLFFILSIFFIDTSAQTPATDSLLWVNMNPLAIKEWRTPDSVSISSAQFVKQVLAHHPYFGFNAPVMDKPVVTHREVKGKETIFYAIVFLFIVFGALRQLFPKYFNDLFRLFFKTTLKQKQVREQLLQTPLPSLALNGFFVISASLYITFLLQHYQLVAEAEFWKTTVYAAAALSIIYLVKYLGIVFSGWLFSMQEAAHAYVFIVFIVNKMIGIFLLPFILILAFSVGHSFSIGIMLAWCVLGGLYLYRIMLTWSAIRGLIKVNPFHFFLYLLAFEVVPLLLIYKALLLYFM